MTDFSQFKPSYQNATTIAQNTNYPYGPGYDSKGNLLNPPTNVTNSDTTAQNTNYPYGPGYDSKGNLLNPPTNVTNSDTTLTDLVKKIIGNVPQQNIPPLNYTPPSPDDIQTKWKEFQDRASKDPDIIKYYQSLLNNAQGNTEIAKGLLQKDYDTGVRQTTDTLNASLKSLGLTFTKESQAKEYDLNERGIALTQNDGRGLTYAGGGQAQTEVQTMNEDQRLRKEAEQRSAQQRIEGLGLSKSKGDITSSQQLASEKLRLQGEQQKDIQGRAGMYQNIWQAQESTKLQQAQIDQQNKSLAGGGGGSSGGDGGGGRRPKDYTGWNNQAAIAADRKATGGWA